VITEEQGFKEQGSFRVLGVPDCVEQPELGFDLKFLGGDIAALPGVEKMIDVSSAIYYPSLFISS
jgi:hypothetical protein